MIDGVVRTITHVFTGIPVTDFDAACRWYERLLDGPADMFPNDGEAVWHLTSQGSIYLRADSERAGRALLTIAVSDLDGETSRLRERGITADERPSGDDGPRRIEIEDPYGNLFTLFEDPAGHGGRGALQSSGVT